jgi:two-component system, NtrC family, sensor kinase
MASEKKILLHSLQRWRCTEVAENDNKEHLAFIVGEERRFKDIIPEAEVLPMLEGAVKAGASLALIRDDSGEILWSFGDQAGGLIESHSIILEGEPVAKLEIHGTNGTDIRGITKLLRHSINTLIRTNLKRMLTSEIHTTIISHSYDELLNINKELSASEQKYRELAESLEEKVKERTKELRQAHTIMLQQEKMASIGSLAAGIAHEINNPMGFISSNLRTLNTYFSKAKDMLGYYRNVVSSIPELMKTTQEKWRQLKLDFVLEDSDSLINESLSGADRITVIVKNLRAVSHIDDTETGLLDINSEIDSIIILLNHETPPGTRFIKNYSIIPGFHCRLALLSQAFLNILLNALQCRLEGLEVTITTVSDGDSIYITIADNGPGIPEDIRTRIFEPFFTTKDVGKGKGLGLTTAYDAITSHNGSIVVENKNGASFKIKLPIRE